MEETAKILFDTYIVLKRKVHRVVDNMAETKQLENPFHKLTRRQMDVVLTVYRNEGATMAFIAERLMISRPSATSIINKLVKMGIVKKEKCEADGRQTRVNICDSVRDFVTEADTHIIKCFENVCRKMDDEDAIMLGKLVKKFKNRLEGN